MNRHTRLKVAVILSGACVIPGFSTTTCTSLYSLSTVGSALAVLATSSNPSVPSSVRVHSKAGGRHQSSDGQWNRRDQPPFAASRTSQGVPTDADADTNDRTGLPASGSSTLDGDSPTEESRDLGENLDEATNDDGTFFVPMNPGTEKNTDDATVDETTNDDVVVVVPMNIAMEQNTDDANSKREEDVSLRSQPTRASNEADNNNNNNNTTDNRRLFGIGVSAVGLSVAGFLFFRRRERGRWMRHRTHEILREQDEAFDLGFRDEDQLELPSFN